MNENFSYQTYQVRRKIFTFMGAKFHVFGPTGEVVLFSKLKAMKFKEDVRLYDGEDMANELVSIHARSIIDFSAVYDITDSQTNEKIGAIKRKGMKSILKDEWEILDNSDQVVGSIQEDSMAMALIRRVLMNLIPQNYSVFIGTKEVATFHQNFNPFVVKLNLDFSKDTECLLDKRLGVAAAIMLCAIDAKQN